MGSNKKNNKWDDIAYQKMSTVEIQSNLLIVTFANGDTVNIPLEKVQKSFNESDIQTTIENYGYSLNLSANGQEEVVPWDRIRVLSDADFAKEMAIQADNYSKKIGSKIKELRQKKGFQSQELAMRSGLTPQTITRIERGQTDVTFSTLRKILVSMGYNLHDLANLEDLELNAKHAFSYKYLLEKLNNLGINSQLISKIVPTYLISKIKNYNEELDELLRKEIAFYLSLVFNWQNIDIWNESKLTIDSSPASAALFKTSISGSVMQLKAYSHYAYYIATLVIKSSKKKSVVSLPQDTEECKRMFAARFHDLSIQNLVEFIWDLGIAVIPLNDSGIFHGAVWNIKGRSVIIVKQKNSSHSRWIFDILHELYHVLAHLDEKNPQLIENQEINPYGNTVSLEEREANSFSNSFMIGDDRENLVRNILTSSNLKIEFVKKSVMSYSISHKIRVDFLANYIAYILQEKDINWWGVANSLQITTPSPFQIVAEILEKKISLNSLSEVEKSILYSAIK